MSKDVGPLNDLFVLEPLEGRQVPHADVGCSRQVCGCGKIEAVARWLAYGEASVWALASESGTTST